jgi:hypothetical protein
MIRWRGAVASAIRGKRGQAFLREMLEALDAIPSQTLIAHDLENLGGVCAIGAVGRRRGVDQSQIDPEDCDTIVKVFGIPLALAAEIMFENDYDGYWREASPKARWSRMRAWVESNIRPVGDWT